MKKKEYAWLFVCYIKEDRKFVVHSIADYSFNSASQTHRRVFPSHNIVFSLFIPVILSDVMCLYFQSFFSDADKVNASFQQLLSAADNSSLVVPVKSYQGFVPLSFDLSARKLVLSAWKGEYYVAADAFVLHYGLLSYFNSILFTCVSNDAHNLFK